MTDPTKDIQALAQRVLDDSQDVAEAITKAAHDASIEGIGLAHEAAQVALDTVAEARTLLEKAIAAAKSAMGGGGSPPAPPTPAA